jgi:hypothetical protein
MASFSRQAIWVKMRPPGGGKLKALACHKTKNVKELTHLSSINISLGFCLFWVFLAAEKITNKMSIALHQDEY